jgi:p70 ribosomal S6 kinase
MSLTGTGRIDMSDFDLLQILGCTGFRTVFLVCKKGGAAGGRLYAMKMMQKATIIRDEKPTEYTIRERRVLEAVRQRPFLVNPVTLSRQTPNYTLF